MDEKFMREAIRLAQKAKKKGEVPIGAVVVLNGKIIGRGYNLRTKLQMATAHAEMRAIDRACRKLHSWRLPGAEIYVTLEPCPMCMGAILNARIDRARERQSSQSQGGSDGRHSERGMRRGAHLLFYGDARAGKEGKEGKALSLSRLNAVFCASFRMISTFTN